MLAGRTLAGGLISLVHISAVSASPDHLVSSLEHCALIDVLLQGEKSLLMAHLCPGYIEEGLGDLRKARFFAVLSGYGVRFNNLIS